jgi:tetratricopeptide (TPR) repeat protein
MLAVVLVTVILVLAGCAGTPGGAAAASDYFNVGNAWYELGKYDKAIAAYERALKLDPGLAKGNLNLALAYVHLKRVDEAVAVLQRLLAVDPQNTQVLSTLAWAYHAGGRDQDALAQYEAVIALSPGDADALYNSAIILWKMDKKQEALARLRTVLERTPDDTDAMFAAAQVLLALDDAAGSSAMISRYLEKKPADVDALYTAAAAAERQQKYARALDAYDALIAADPTQATALFAEARLLLTVVQDPQRGLDTLDKALAAGFKDKDAAGALLDAANLLEQDKVRAALQGHDLVAAPTGTTPPSDTTQDGG